MAMKIITKSDQVHCTDIDCLTLFNGNLISSDSSGAVKTWSPDLKLLDEFHPHGEYPVYHLLADEGGKRLYTCSSDSKILEWKRQNGQQQWELVNTLEGHDEQTVRRLAIRGNHLFSGDESGQVNLWEDGKKLATFDLVEEIWDLVVNGNILITVRIQDVVLSELVPSNQEGYRCSVKQVLQGRPPLFLSTNNRLCFMERNGLNISVAGEFETKSVKIEKLEGHKLIVNAMTGYENKLFSGGWDKKVIQWDLETNKSIGEIELDGYINAMAFMPTGKRLFVAGENSIIYAVQVS